MQPSAACVVSLAHRERLFVMRDSFFSEAENMNEVIQLLLGLLGGLGGAIIGANVAFRRMRSEKAFERRLMWCESGLKTLHEAGAALVAAYEADPAAPQAERCWTEAIRRYEELIPVCGQKELYASSEGCRALTQFMSAFWSVIDGHLRGHSSDASAGACRTCLDRLQDAGLALSMEARKHLRLDRLPSNQLDASNQFRGSFKGRLGDWHRLDVAAVAKSVIG
jgi:hypothetical protein